MRTSIHTYRLLFMHSQYRFLICRCNQTMICIHNTGSYRVICRCNKTMICFCWSNNNVPWANAPSRYEYKIQPVFYHTYIFIPCVSVFIVLDLPHVHHNDWIWLILLQGVALEKYVRDTSVTSSVELLLEYPLIINIFLADPVGSSHSDPWW